MRDRIALGALFGGLLLVWNFVFFTVDQTEQALVVQLGQPQRVVTEPGLNVEIFAAAERHLFREARPGAGCAVGEVLYRPEATGGRHGRPRIVDPLKFYQTVNNVSPGEQRRGAPSSIRTSA
ncbi:MAG: hypothetical protein U1F24_10550 [Alphaproteobacteria bacterium]